MAVGRPWRTGRAGPPQTQIAGDVLGALGVGVVVLDADDRPVFANPAASELGLVGDGGVHAVVRTLAGQVRRGAASSAAAGGARHREVELELPRPRGRGPGTGGPLGVRVRVTPLSGPDYAAGHVAIEAFDVTEAHRLARVRRDFVANVSHELKTPVGALALLAEALLEAADDPEASRRFADRIHHESQRLARLVKELLELSRLQGAEPLPRPVPVTVDRIVNEVLDRTRTAASAKEIALTFIGSRRLIVYGDEGQLVTAVANLVENAIAYSPGETKVTLEAHRSRDMVEVSVTDQGIGIAPADLDRIFERFYRADQARSRDTGGTGLGLAIVKHIAENHGGRVDVESTIGEGSRFTLHLPVRPPEVDDPLPPGVEIGLQEG
jgi:two-component system sensor histidine kinase SenX3